MLVASLLVSARRDVAGATLREFALAMCFALALAPLVHKAHMVWLLVPYGVVLGAQDVSHLVFVFLIVIGVAGENHELLFSDIWEGGNKARDGLPGLVIGVEWILHFKVVHKKTDLTLFLKRMHQAQVSIEEMTNSGRLSFAGLTNHEKALPS